MPRSFVSCLTAVLLTAALCVVSAAIPSTLGAQECDPNQVFPPCDVTPPEVTITPATGTFGGATKTITIEWCDEFSLRGGDQWITLNGASVTASFNYVPGNRSGCTAFATSTGTVPLTLGPNTLQAGITDDAFNEGTGSASYTLNNGYITIDGSFNNNENQRLAACEASCFAAVYAQSTVPYVSMDAPQGVTLIYHGDRAFPMPFVYVDVTGFTSDTPTIQEYWLEANVNGALVTFRNTETRLRFAGQQDVRRFGGQLDMRDLATGMYPLDIILTTVFAGATEAKTISSQLLVVNDSSSKIARGWQVAGVQRIHDRLGDGTQLVITGGDGSGAHYASCGTNCWTKPRGEYSELSYDGTAQTYTRAYRDSTKVTFNARGLMTRVTDRLGHTVNFEYDASDRLWKIEDPYRTYSGGTLRSYITLVYGANGLARIEEPGADGTPSTGRVTTVTVDANRRLTAIADPDNVSTTFGYDSDGRLSAVTDRNGGISTFVYDAPSWKLAELRMPQVAIDAGGGATQLATPVTTFRPWQTVGVPTTLTSGTPATPFHPDSTVGRVTDPEARETSFRVDRWGQPTRIIDPVGRVTTITRNGDGFATAVTSPTGAVDLMSFAGPLVTSVQPAGQNPTYIRYGVAAQPDSIYGPGQRWQRLYLDSLTGRVESVKIQDVDSLVRYTYDARHRVIEMKDQNSHRWVYRYDARTGNRDSTHTWPSNHFAVTRFDAYGRDSASFAEGQLVGRVIYDLVNRPKEHYAGSMVAPTVMTYGALFTEVRDAKGQVYRSEHNVLGWLTREVDPTTAAMSYRHDRTGLVKSWSNRRGEIVDYRYDGVGRLVSKRGVNVAADSFAYSADDRKVMALSPQSLDSLYLNIYGQADSAVTWLNGKRYRRQYRWNGNGSLDSLGISTTSGITFAQRRYVTPRGLLDTLRVSGQAIRYTYDKEFQRTSTVFPVGSPNVTRSEYYTSLHQRYRTSFNTTAIDGELWQNYVFEARGRIAQEDRKYASGSGTKIRTFEYDDRGQLTSAQLSRVSTGIECPEPTGTEVINDGTNCAPTSNRVLDASYEFHYDSAGNLRQQTDTLSGATVSGVHGTGNRITSWGGATFGHDADGNRTSRSAGGVTTTYGWSAEGRLTSVSSGGTMLGYDYNAAGQPVRRTRNGVAERYFLWDGDHLMAEINASSQRVAEYVYEPGVDNPVALVTGATGIAATRYLEEDELGNVVGVFNTALAQTLVYDVRGKVESITGTVADTNRLRWKGLMWEGDLTQLYYVRNRWYDPETGRFMTEDPIGLDGGLNVYVFGGNDLINLADPWGLDPCTQEQLDHGWKTVDGQCEAPNKLPTVVVTAEPSGGPRVSRIILRSRGGNVMSLPAGGGGGSGALARADATKVADPASQAAAQERFECAVGRTSRGAGVGYSGGALVGAAYGLAVLGPRFERVGAAAGGALFGATLGPEAVPVGFVLGRGTGLLVAMGYGSLKHRTAGTLLGTSVGAVTAANCP